MEEEPTSSSAADAADQHTCPICLSDLDTAFAKSNACSHRFDEECIYEWAKHQTNCPNCRAEFEFVYTYSLLADGKTKLIRTKKFERKTQKDASDYANTTCEICETGSDEHQILLCDGCDKGFHTYCLDPPIETIPRGRWYCPDCEPVRRPQVASRQQQQTQRRLVTRTALAERVRRNLFTRATQNSRRREILPEEELLLGSDGDQTEEDELEDEEGQDVSDEEGENEEEDVEDEGEAEGSEGEEEEAETSFAEEDSRVLDDEEPITRKKLPEVKRGKRKTKKQTKRKTKGRGRKRRARRRKSRRRAKRVPVTDGPMTAYLNQVRKKKGSIDSLPFPKLSVLGADMEPIDNGDEVNQATIFSRCFDRPLFARASDQQKQKAQDGVSSEAPQASADNFDLLGTIIPEQTKTLAPGKLFCVGDGKFKETEEFERYKKKKEGKMSENLKKQLGIETKSNSSSEMEETASPSKTTSKEKPITAEEEKDGKSIAKTEPKNVIEEKDGNVTIKIEPETVSNEKEAKRAESSDNQKEEGEIDRPKSDNSNKSSTDSKKEGGDRQRTAEVDRRDRDKNDRNRDESRDSRRDDRNKESRVPPPPPRPRNRSQELQQRTVVNLLDERPMEMRLNRPPPPPDNNRYRNWSGGNRRRRDDEGALPERRDDRNGVEPPEKRRREDDRRRPEVENRDESERGDRKRPRNRDEHASPLVYDRVAEITRDMEKIRENEKRSNKDKKKKKKYDKKDRKEGSHSSSKRSRSRSNERRGHSRDRRYGDSSRHRDSPSPTLASSTLGSILPRRPNPPAPLPAPVIPTSQLPSLLSMSLLPPVPTIHSDPPMAPKNPSPSKSAKIEDHQSIQYLSALLAQRFNEVRREKPSLPPPPPPNLNSSQMQAHKQTSEKISKYEEKRNKQHAVERYSKPIAYRAFKEKIINKDQYKNIMKTVNKYCVRQNILDSKAIEDITDREIDKVRNKLLV
ncbi:hypothetical protein WR25_15642 [Diploscapter pachys]|uniref:PHD and RING finger domain-containing protein 1 n=1 Tax=Diploscapter pachys TaxID=2018661 RepID=A0A2A2KUX0_9BILA|nr:hypothetical protein WR25_15642 [Diploscapter pachys]